ncbi:hypothetical protein [Xanthobacter autotrophicus]|uniref:hypothetical protein n=1 Tax=Xanthobacter autotrophicus TaxID=280 RepID=UPI00372C4C2B
MGQAHGLAVADRAEAFPDFPFADDRSQLLRHERPEGPAAPASKQPRRLAIVQDLQWVGMVLRERIEFKNERDKLLKTMKEKL